MSEVPRLLHPTTFDNTPIYGSQMRQSLLSAVHVVDSRTGASTDREMTVLIRTKNDAATLEDLFEEIDGQAYDHDPQIIAVDTESTDGTADIVRAHGGTVINIAQREFTYPHALNLGFEAANTDIVFSIVGHSNLSNNMTFRAAGHWASYGYGAAYGVSLPNHNATWTERIGAVQLGLPRLLRPASREREDQIGILATNCAAISVEAWREMGGFDARFASGGEDGAMARKMLAAGVPIAREPALSVHHTHGLGPINGLKQLLHWRGFKEGAPFDESALLRFRPDLRDKQN